MLAYSSKDLTPGFYIKENTGGPADEKSVTRHKKSEVLCRVQCMTCSDHHTNN